MISISSPVMTACLILFIEDSIFVHLQWSQTLVLDGDELELELELEHELVVGQYQVHICARFDHP